MNHKILILVVIVFALSSCTAVQEETAFERTVDFYRHSGDTLKMRAAEYLRDNSMFHHSIPRYLTDSGGRRIMDIDYNDFDTDTMFVDYLRSNGYYFYEGDMKADRVTVTDEYLRKNIDLAFDSWQMPWAKSIGFNDFCTYILPYRNMDEELDDWRSYFKNKYEPTIIDSVSDPTSIREVALYLIRRLKEEVSYSPPVGRLYKNYMGFSEMQRIHYLECGGLAHYGTLALRACGIPCATIETFWRFNEVSHFSILLPLLGSNKHACRLSIYDELQEMGEPKDTMASYRTWLYSYESNSSLVNLSHKEKRMDYYTYPVTRQDITWLFSKTYNITLPISEEVLDDQYIFLCRFSHWKWFPIREGVVKEGNVTFQNATIRQWYRLGIIQGDSLHTFGKTFTILGPQVADSLKSGTPDYYTIQYYDCLGDSVHYKMVYNCQPDERRLTRSITTYYWDTNMDWHPIQQDAILWGLNEKTGEYRVFDESMRKNFKPVFHLLQTDLPSWTVFFDNEIPRPLGFICKDPDSNEGYFMQF